MATVETERDIHFVSGTLNALNDELRLSCRNVGVVGIQLTGTWAASVSIEGSLDGTNWVAVPYSNAAFAPRTDARTSNALLQVFTQYFDFLRVRLSAYTSGTVVAALRGQVECGGVNFASAMDLNAGTALIGDVGIQVRVGSGVSTVRAVAAASGVIKASAGKIVSYDLLNTSAAVKYMQIYNKATAGVPGTDTPVYTIPIPANGNVSFGMLSGLYTAATGLSWAITTDAAGATAGASGDIVGSFTFA